MDVVGYSDPLSVRPGDTIDFMVSCNAASYHANVVRLIHGDENPLGPGFREQDVPTSIDGEYAGGVQAIHNGSAVEVSDHAALRPTSVTVAAHILATTPLKGRQGILTKWSKRDEVGYGLFLDGEGHAEFRVRTPRGTHAVRTALPLVSHRWYLVVGSYEPQSGRVAITKVSREIAGNEAGVVDAVEAVHGAGEIIHSDGPVLMAASWAGSGSGLASLDEHFNGKVGAPELFGVGLDAERISDLATDNALDEVQRISKWDLASGSDSSRVADLGQNGLDGTALNMPTRAVTGHLWKGGSSHFESAPSEYNAIHFHDDDLEDAGWATSVSWDIPGDLPSGIYALRLRTSQNDGGAVDHVPFFVLPAEAGSVPVAFLAPTNCYFAYADERLEDNLGLPGHPDYQDPNGVYDYIVANRLLSMYDRHSDGSGVCYSTRLRPNLTMRPRHRMRVNNIPHLLASDLHITEWLESEGHDFDVLTEEALHHEGLDLLSGYRVVITGSHPEYWSAAMLDSLGAYLATGGRCMYLGGNAFYWVTAFDPERPHVMEVRRLPGSTRAWEAWPGEYHLSSTGEYGGLWRHRGKAPQLLVGNGFSAQGFDHSAPYYVNPDLSDDMEFVFDGVDRSDGRIAHHESLVLSEGAAGFELDRVDHLLGTPTGTYVLASTRHGDFSDSYQAVVEDTMMSDSQQGGSVNPNVRSDIVIVQHSNGGAVFSVGSIAWSGGLSIDEHQSDVSKITRNVLNAFLTEESIGG
jgi:N,N-dimethylformamidase